MGWIGRNEAKQRREVASLLKRRVSSQEPPAGLCGEECDPSSRVYMTCVDRYTLDMCRWGRTKRKRQWPRAYDLIIVTGKQAGIWTMTFFV